MYLVSCNEFFMLNTERQTQCRTGANPMTVGTEREWINQYSYKEEILNKICNCFFFLFHKLVIEDYNL